MAGSAVAPRPDHPTLDNLTLARKEGWAAFVNAAPRRRPESLTRSAISALGDAAANEYNLRRREWHANLGPLKTPQLVALHEDLWDILDSNLQDGDKAKSAVAIDAFPGPHPSTDPQDGRQTAKDYVLFPVLSRRRWRRTLEANVAANLLRNVWAYVVICCGHFPDGAEKFTPAALEGETKPEWYLRQMLGTANFDAGPVLAFLSGNLCYQIEHHLFPDLPSNRYARDRPTGAGGVRHLRPALHHRSAGSGNTCSTLRTIHKLALPDRFLIRHLRRRTRDGVRGQVPQRRNDRTCQPWATRTRRDADWVARYWTERIGGPRLISKPWGGS